MFSERCWVEYLDRRISGPENIWTGEYLDQRTSGREKQKGATIFLSYLIKHIIFIKISFTLDADDCNSKCCPSIAGTRNEEQ